MSVSIGTGDKIGYVTPESNLTRKQLRALRESQQTVEDDDLGGLLSAEPEHDTDVTVPARNPKRARKRLTFLGVLQELLAITAVLGAFFAYWYLYGDDWVKGRQNDAKSAVVAEQWSPSSTELGWLGGTDIPVTPASHVPAETYATIQVPRFGTDYIRTIANGISVPNVLNQGYFGHYDRTQDVGEIGNYAIAAHRSTAGSPLYDIDKMNVGDPVIVRTELGWYIYRITDKRITTPQDVASIYPVPDADISAKPTQRWMTLTTCHPYYSDAQRYIAHAIFDRFVPSGQATPHEVTTPADSDGKVYVTTSVPAPVSAAPHTPSPGFPAAQNGLSQ